MVRAPRVKQYFADWKDKWAAGRESEGERTPLCETINRLFHFLSPRFSVTSVKQIFSISHRLEKI